MQSHLIVFTCMLLSMAAVNEPIHAAGFGTILGTDIHGAAKKGKIKKVIKLVETKGVDVNKKNGAGNTALEFAAWQGHLNVVDYLLSKGARINEQDNAGQSALHLAVTFDRQEVAELLIDRGADINQVTDKGETPLIRAAINAREKMVDVLISQGANLQIRDTSGKTALDWAYTLKKEWPGRAAIVAKLSASAGSDMAASAKENFESNQNKPKQASRRNNELVVCKEQDTPDLDENGNKALRYLIRKRFSQHGLGTSDRLCIETITVRDKITIRGETVIKYSAGLMFPKGHLVKCLDKRSTQGANWINNSECVVNVGIKPQWPGGRGNYDGEETI